MIIIFRLPTPFVNFLIEIVHSHIQDKIYHTYLEVIILIYIIYQLIAL